MRRFRTFFALFLAALWLPATQHCDLEAAGMLSAHCDQPAGMQGTGADDHCAGDGCDVVESGGYKVSSNTAKVSAPTLAVLACLFTGDSLSHPAETSAGTLLGSDHGHPVEWVPTWQFVQRAALSPRAPSGILS